MVSFKLRNTCCPILANSNCNIGKFMLELGWFIAYLGGCVVVSAKKNLWFGAYIRD
jgi:hypothetical protein